MKQFNEIYIPIATIIVGVLLAVQLIKRFVDSLGTPEKPDWYWKNQTYDPYNKKSDDFGFVHEKPKKETSGQKGWERPRDAHGRFLKSK